MRTPTAILAAATLIAASLTTAHAATLTVGYANVSLNTGNGLSSSVPALRLAAQADLPDGYDLTASVTHGKREAASDTDAHVAINGNLPLAIGTLQPGLVTGYTRIDYSGSYFHDGPGWRMASGYAGRASAICMRRRGMFHCTPRSSSGATSPRITPCAQPSADSMQRPMLMHPCALALAR